MRGVILLLLNGRCGVEAEAREKRIERLKATIESSGWKHFKVSDNLISLPKEQAKFNIKQYLPVNRDSFSVNTDTTVENTARKISVKATTPSG